MTGASDDEAPGKSSEIPPLTGLGSDMSRSVPIDAGCCIAKTEAYSELC